MSQRDGEEVRTIDRETDKMSSEVLAALIVGALVDAGILSEVSEERAIAIAAERIEIRKLLGDY